MTRNQRSRKSVQYKGAVYRLAAKSFWPNPKSPDAKLLFSAYIIEDVGNEYVLWHGFNMLRQASSLQALLPIAYDDMYEQDDFPDLYLISGDTISVLNVEGEPTASWPDKGQLAKLNRLRSKQ
jgi:hypothetical protein